MAAQRTDIKSGTPLEVNIGRGRGLRVVDFVTQQWKLLGAVGKIRAGVLADRSGQPKRLVADPIGLNPLETSLSS